MDSRCCVLFAPACLTLNRWVRLAKRLTTICRLKVSELNLEEGGAFTVSSAEEILSGAAACFLAT